MGDRRSGFVLLAIVFAAVAGGALLFRLGLGGPEPSEQAEPPRESAVMTKPGWPESCLEQVFEGARAILCNIDPHSHEIRLVYRDRAGEILGSVSAATAQLAAEEGTGRRLVLAMNAGMYHADMSPVGLYVEELVEAAPLNTDDGFGNFFLKPNGVFFVRKDGGAGVLETQAYAEAGVSPAFATQSGPMLVINGAIHPRFLPDGSSKFIRNGVGVRADGTVVFAITRDRVSLGTFARLFRDRAGCDNALFFDGEVSSLALGREMEIDSGEPAGPVAVVMKREKPGDS
jgi:uncharacterized protein YigE (DUF2233 family)